MSTKFKDWLAANVVAVTPCGNYTTKENECLTLRQLVQYYLKEYGSN
jgi:hypothetical protein